MVNISSYKNVDIDILIAWRDWDIIFLEYSELGFYHVFHYRWDVEYLEKGLSNLANVILLKDLENCPIIESLRELKG